MRRTGNLLGIALALGAAALVAAVAGTGAWQGFEQRAQGLVLSHRGPLPWNDQVVVIDLDDESLDAFGTPTPKGVHARVLGALAAAGARAVAYDILFVSAPSDGPEGEAAFAEALSTYGRAVLMLECSYIAGREPERSDAVLARNAWDVPDLPSDRCRSVVLPRPALTEAATVAHVVVAHSHSGYHRSEFAFVEGADHTIPSLPLAAWALAHGERPPLRHDSAGLWVGDRRLAIDGRGAALVSWRSLPREHVLPFHLVAKAVDPVTGRLGPEDAALFRDRFVVVGSTAPTLHDIGTVTLLVVLVWLALALAGRDLRLGPLAPGTAAVAAFAVALSARLIRDERERRVLASAFGAYVHPDVLRRILDDPESTLSLAGARKQVTVLF